MNNSHWDLMIHESKWKLLLTVPGFASTFERELWKTLTIPLIHPGKRLPVPDQEDVSDHLQTRKGLKASAATKLLIHVF